MSRKEFGFEDLVFTYIFSRENFRHYHKFIH